MKPALCGLRTGWTITKANWSNASQKRAMNRLTIIGVVLFTTHLCAFADPCLSGTVGQLLTQVQNTGPCTIGDLTFDFTSFSAPPTDVNLLMQFVPVTGNHPGFELMGSQFDIAALQSFLVFLSGESDCTYQCHAVEDLHYTVSGGREALTGMSVSLIGANFLFEPDAGAVAGVVGADVEASMNFGNLSADAGAGQEQFFPAAPVTSFGNDPATFSPVSSLTGYVEVSAHAGGSYQGQGPGYHQATLDGAEFTFTETPKIPEPQSILLLATLVLLVIVQIRRRDFTSKLRSMAR